DLLGSRDPQELDIILGTLPEFLLATLKVRPVARFQAAQVILERGSQRDAVRGLSVRGSEQTDPALGTGIGVEETPQRALFRDVIQVDHIVGMVESPQLREYAPIATLLIGADGADQLITELLHSPHRYGEQLDQAHRNGDRNGRDQERRDTM